MGGCRSSALRFLGISEGVLGGHRDLRPPSFQQDVDSCQVLHASDLVALKLYGNMVDTCLPLQASRAQQWPQRDGRRSWWLDLDRENRPRSLPIDPRRGWRPSRRTARTFSVEKVQAELHTAPHMHCRVIARLIAGRMSVFAVSLSDLGQHAVMTLDSWKGTHPDELFHKRQ